MPLPLRGRGAAPWRRADPVSAAGRPRRALAPLVAAMLLILSAPALAQGGPVRLPGQPVERAAGAALAILGFATIPDGTASDLSIDQGQERTALLLGQLGLGFTVSESVPLYLEGFLGYARYDPVFVLTDGDGEARRVPARWNNLAATIGVGWSFPLTDRLQLRPIVNASLGGVASDLFLTAAFIEAITGREIEFLKRGRMLVGGLGGSLVLAWYDYRPEYEFEAELRYTQMRLETLDTNTRGFDIRSDNATIGLWTRYRWPTGREAFGRPVRWVLEGMYSHFLLDQRDALGFDALIKVGAGIELDVGRFEVGAFGLDAQRVRLMARYVYGDNVTGYSIGIGISLY